MNALENRIKVIQYRLDNDNGELTTPEKYQLQLLQKEYERRNNSTWQKHDGICN